MPMIGGEAAEAAALARRPVADEERADGRDPYDLGWVVDWLYGDAVLPPMPLPREPAPVLPPRRGQPAPAYALGVPVAAARGGRARKRRARRLALL